ncbi:MAG: hypothetical protein NTW19_22875 [Planctomycetota bacterium]|nr:hypothetical protein [Planctomycetota bacterium]
MEPTPNPNPTSGNPGNPGQPVPSPRAKASPPTLSPQDAAALDALLAARWREAGATPADLAQATDASNTAASADPARTQKMAELLGLIGQAPAMTPPLDLVQRTLARAERAKREEQAVLDEPAGVLPLRARWAELGTVAAVVLIGLSLMVPMLDRMRADARRIACANNLGEAGEALASYASDYNNTLPRREAEPGSVWWNVGKNTLASGPVESNSAHLFNLVRGGYAQPDALNCPENDRAVRGLSPKMNDWPTARAVSYSYQNQYARDPMQIDHAPHMALLADKNPLFMTTNSPLNYNTDQQRRSASVLHRRQGQNILRAGGDSFWSSSPELSNGDNIWLANHVDRYTGTETPSGPDDSFLVP